MATYIQFKQLRTIANITRLKNSRNGNPRFQIGFTNGEVMTTKTDSSFGYIITHNWQGKDVLASYHFTPKGKPILDDATLLIG